jgi:hypothetical protein
MLYDINKVKEAFPKSSEAIIYNPTCRACWELLRRGESPYQVLDEIMHRYAVLEKEVYEFRLASNRSAKTLF